MHREKGLVIVLSGPSGAGKSTVIGGLLKRRDDIRFSVSATTRDPRPGEEDGRDYYFRTREEFLRMIDKNSFLEYAEYVGNYYGTPAGPVDQCLEAGYNVLLDIEVQGAAQVMERRPDAVSVFLCPPSLQELERRLRGRSTDSEEKIKGRLDKAVQEIGRMPTYNYTIINDVAEDAVRELDAIITAERCRTARKLYIISEGDFIS